MRAIRCPIAYVALVVALCLPAAPAGAADDTSPPTLMSLSLSPTSVDTSSAPQTVMVTARITDDLAGNAGAGYSSSPSQGRFRSPSGGQFVDAILSESERVSGSALDGVYQYAMTVPAFAEQGTWTVEYILLVDQVGNFRYFYPADLTAAGFPTGFEVGEPLPSLSVAHVWIEEGDSGTTPMTFTVTLDQPSERNVSVSYGTHAMTAKSPSVGMSTRIGPSCSGAGSRGHGNSGARSDEHTQLGASTGAPVTGARLTPRRARRH